MRSVKLRHLAAIMSVAIAGVALADMRADTSTPAMTVFGDQKASPGTVRVSKLFDVTVRDSAGKDVGHITDIVLDRDRTEVGYIALAQGMPNMGGRKVFAVPYAAVQYGGPNDSDLHLKIPADALAKAKPIDESMYPTQASSELDQWIADNIKLPMAQPAGALIKPDEPAAVLPPALPADAMWSERCSRLIGSDIISPSGDKLGTLKDIVVDRSNGHITYAVLGREMMGIPGDYYAVPMEAFRAQAENRKLVLGVTPDQLSNMPNIDKDHWPSIADPRWAAMTNRGQPTTQPAVP